MRGTPLCLLCLCLYCLTALPLCMANCGEATRFDKPMVRIFGLSSTSENEEVIVLGAAVDKGTVVASFDDVEGLRKLTVLTPNGQRASPKVIVLLPSIGIAAISTDPSFSTDNMAEVKAGDQLRIIRYDTGSDTLVVTNGLASSTPGSTNGFSIDVAVGNSPKVGIVVDENRQLVGVVITRSEKTVRALDVKAIQLHLRRFRASDDDRPGVSPTH